MVKNPHVTAEERKRVVDELLDNSDEFETQPTIALSANTILLSDYIDKSDTEKIMSKFENSPFFTQFWLQLAQRAKYMSRNQMSVVSRRSLEYISPSYPKARSPYLFTSQLAVALQTPGAAASIDKETLDRGVVQLKNIEILIDLDLSIEFFTEIKLL